MSNHDSEDQTAITAVTDTSAPGCDLVRQWLREHNWTANPHFMEEFQKPEYQTRPLVLLTTAGSTVVGGLFAETQFAWLRISIMAVSPEWRSQGIGAALLAEAEREAVERGCKYAYVDTMEYQAPRFYLAHGFAIAGQIPDWDSHGHTKFYLSKRLAAIDGPSGERNITARRTTVPSFSRLLSPIRLNAQALFPFSRRRLLIRHPGRDR